MHKTGEETATSWVQRCMLKSTTPYLPVGYFASFITGPSVPVPPFSQNTLVDSGRLIAGSPEDNLDARMVPPR